GEAGEVRAGAGGGGGSLAGLAGLAQEMYERSCRDGGPGCDGPGCGGPGCDGPGQRDDGFEDRWLRLGITFRGAGRAEGDLTPGCAAALAAVLEALGKK